MFDFRKWREEEWFLVAVVSVVALVWCFIGFLVYDVRSYNAACEAKGGLVWTRDGRACLLPPYNRVEL